MFLEFTQYIDFAQVALYVFWLFFLGLVLWLRKEDRREGYPLEGDNPALVDRPSWLFLPPPKTYLKPHGGTYSVPNDERDTRPINARRTSAAAGSPFEPVGDPLSAGVGPGSYAKRPEESEKTREGLDLIVPMRAEPDFKVTAGADPRGFKVTGADGKIAGTVRDVWVDRADLLIRYVEVALENGGSRLVPMVLADVDGEARTVAVGAVKADQFAGAPATRSESSVTLDEEERIGAYYAAGRLYATPARLGPAV